jgi:hypothetical protein
MTRHYNQRDSSTKLDENDVKMIRELVQYRDTLRDRLAIAQSEVDDLKLKLRGLSDTAIGEKFDIDRKSVARAFSRMTWKHVG